MRDRLLPIQLQLLDRLNRAKEPVSSQFLANSLGVSSKTIRAHLNNLNQYLSAQGAQIESKTGTGYWLTVTCRSQFDGLMQHLALDHPRHIVNPVQLDRTHLVIRHLLCQPGYTKIEELDDLLFMNRTSTKQNISRARGILDQFQLKITSKSRHGLKISGREHDIRLCLNYEYGYFTTTSLRPSQAEEYSRLYRFEPRLLQAMEKIIQRCQNTFASYNLSVSSLAFLSRLILISKVRNQAGFHLEYREQTLIRFTNRNSYYVAKLVLGQCGELLNCSFSREDVILVAMCLVGFRVALKPEEMFRDGFLESKDIAFDLIQHLAQINQFSAINKDIRLVDDIALHLDGLFTRSRYHLKTTQFSSEIRIQLSLMARKLAMQAMVYLHQKHEIEISEEEIIRLALVIHPVFGRFPWKFQKVRACCVSNIDKSTGKGMAERLQRNFDRFIEEIDVLELYELQEKDLSVYRILFTSCSTEELDFLPDSLAVVQTELFFDEREKQRIRGILVNGSRARDFRMRDYLHPESIYTGLEAGSEQECIDGICRILQPMLKNPEALRNDLIQCETMMPSRPRDNVIFLSGLRAQTQRAFVAVFVLKRPVHWNQSLHKAQIIVYWDRGKAAQDAESFENEYIPHLLEKVFQDRNIIDEMVKNPDYEHLMEVMMEIHSAVLTMGSSFR